MLLLECFKHMYSPSLSLQTILRMSSSGRKRVSKWDAKQEATENGNDYVEKSGSYYHDKDPEHAGFYPEGNGRNGSSRRSVPDDDDNDDERLKSRQQHQGEAWPSRSRVSHDEGDDAMMSYYDTRKSSEQDETRQPYWDRPRTRRSVSVMSYSFCLCNKLILVFVNRSGSRSNSRSMSRSRSRSPLQRVRRDARGSYDRHKTRDNDGRYSRAGDYNDRDTKYYTEDSREQYPLRRSDYPEDHSNSRREASDPIMRSHRDRRDVPEREYNRVSNVPCRYFALRNCRNGTSCRFSHHGAPPARRSPERKPQDQMFSSGTTERMRNSHRWNERSDTGKSCEGSKGNNNNNNNGSWIGDMEMSPDWNYSAHNLKKRMKEEPGVGSIGQSSKSRVDDQRSSGMYSYGDNKPMLEKPIVADSHQNYNNVVNTAPPVQAYNQNHHDVLPYQNSPTPGGTQHQVIAPESVKAYQDNHHSVVEKAVPVQSGVTREQIDQISNISATIAQLLANRRPLPQLTQALQMPSSLAVQPNHATQSNNPLGMSADTDEAPLVTASQVSNVDEIQVLPVNTKASQTDAASKEEECKKAGEDVKEADNIVDEDDDDGSEEEEEEEDKKEMKDTKGMRTFKFALVEIVKELLKPAWKEGKMKKDGYKNIVKKVVEKVTGSMQSGNVPQTQEKIDHYLSASKPKLTKLVQVPSYI